MTGDELAGQVVILTRMTVIPHHCTTCRYYDPNRMGRGKPGLNTGVCLALLRTTSDIKVSETRLPNCPLRLIEEVSPHEASG